MPGPSLQRLVLVTWTATAAVGQEDPAPGSIVGTGYFITRDLILTACHVAPEDSTTLVSVRVEQGAPLWRKDGGRQIWRDAELDAALILVDDPLPADIEPVQWRQALPAEDCKWTSTAYPDAAKKEVADDKHERKSSGLRGTLYVQGGGGQGQKELELGVDNPPPMMDWRGASGAPIFVDDELVGILKSTGFDGQRFHGLPAGTLLQRVDFLRAIEPSWRNRSRSGPWLLVLLSESGSDELASTVVGSLERHSEAITKSIGPRLKDAVVAMRVTDVLSTPERWLEFVEALCAAPIMIADVTGFEPGVMLALGVRAVVRRGVTIASTSARLDDAQLSKLPFNIQETKLISHGDAEKGITEEHPRYSLNIIASTVLSGTRELNANPRYLDLPAYDAVRCPAPELPTEQNKARETVLVLCSFHRQFASNWKALSDALAKRYPSKQVVRMRDIVSPRLVGQALYEHIRWTATCVVDWTGWRANVFFEYGVRLACSKVEPVCLLHEADTSAQSLQKQALQRLFSPNRYSLPGLKPTLHASLAAHEAQKALGEGEAGPPRAPEQVPYSGTHNICLANFEYAQDRATLSPQALLRNSVEALLGKDRQKSGQTPVLFASNPEFSRKLRRSVRERWIAAWYYLCHRNAERDASMREELRQIGETLLQEVRDDPGDPSIAKLRQAVVDLLDEQEDDGEDNQGA